ncbi:hypothetical protein ACLB2K_071252 [Fragaria x ananassa]
MAGEVSLCVISGAGSRSDGGQKKETTLLPRPTSPASSSISTDDPGEYSGENEIDDLLYGKDDVKGISDFICKQDLVAVDDYMKMRREKQASLAHCFPFFELISFCKLF